MASPLNVYIPIKQDPMSQAQAARGVQVFADAVEDQFNLMQMVHYATLALVPNPPKENGRSIGAIGILLMTDFDGQMNAYLEGFYESPGVNDALSALATLSLTPVPEINSLTEFVNFFNDHNLTPAPAGDEWDNYYQAYPDKTVKQIVPAP